MRFLRFFGVLFLTGAMPAVAQQMPYSPAPQQPYQQAYEKQAQVFPPLPPSRACTARDVLGIWKLHLVYETPVGSDMTNFITNPVQYLVFNANDTFGGLSSGRKEAPPQVIRNAIAREQAKTLMQYVVDPSGFVYFYENGQAMDTRACFIVAVQQEPFFPGQMLLMPPEGQSKERLLKVYVRVNERRGNPRR